MFWSRSSVPLPLLLRSRKDTQYIQPAAFSMWSNYQLVSLDLSALIKSILLGINRYPHILRCTGFWLRERCFFTHPTNLTWYRPTRSVVSRIGIETLTFTWSKSLDLMSPPAVVALTEGLLQKQCSNLWYKMECRSSKNIKKLCVISTFQSIYNSRNWSHLSWLL